MTFRIAILDSIAATTFKFVNNVKTYERCNYIFKCRKVKNFSFSKEKKRKVIVGEFVI